MGDAQLFYQVCGAGIVFILAISIDLSTEKIPNWLTFSALFCGFAINTYFAQLNGVLVSFLGFALAFAILFPTFMLKILGAGDIKLMMGIGAFMGPQLLFTSVIYGIIAGTLTSIILVISKTGVQGLYQTFKRYKDCIVLGHYFKPEANEAAGQRVAYAPALGIGWLFACILNPHINATFSSFSENLFS